MALLDAQQARRCVVVVEDDIDVRETLSEVLREEGYCVMAFGDGQKALAAVCAERHLPALILLDLMMPKMDGWAFRAEQARLVRPLEIPTVILSADGNVEENLASLSAQGYLRKPVHIKALLLLVQRFCSPPAAK